MNVHEFKRPMTLEQVLSELAEIEDRLKTYESGGKFDRDAWRRGGLLGCLQYAAHKANVLQAILDRMSPSMLKWIEPQVRAELASHNANIARGRLAFSHPDPDPETTP